MPNLNPLLADHPLPAFSAIRPEHVFAAIDSLLAAHGTALAALLASPSARTFASLMRPLEELDDQLERAWAPVSHLHSVVDSEALRRVYAPALERITEHATELGQNRALFAAVQAVAASADFRQLSRAEQTIVEDALRDFRLSGVALEEPGRTRFKAIANEMAKLGSEFEEAVLDATAAWSLPIEHQEALAGIPESGLSVLREAAESQGLPGWLITLKQPSYLAVMTYADDRDLRRTVYHAYQTRASDQGPNGGQFDNSQRIERILALRHEAAGLLGFANAADESLATKMAPSAQGVIAFLEDLASRAKPVAQRELAELADYARSALGLAEIESWDLAYAAEKLRVAKYSLSEEDLKPYFELEAALTGLFAITARLFGVRLMPRATVDTWHADVRYFDVLDADGSVIAGAYFDLYARDNKRGGAWMDVCRSRRRDAQGTQLPVAFLSCNFAPPSATQPALLTHDDVLTLFHEFGHGLHLMLTEVDYPSVGGISGVEWDAVELPSQFLENFAWERDALDLFARHWQSAARLPDALFERMQAARHFHAGLFLVRQLEFALFDFRLHRDYDPQRGARVREILAEVRAAVAVVRPPDWQRFAQSFTHIFSGGYGAGYYSYLWAEVLSTDAYDRFLEAGIFDAATGAEFRRNVLAVGGSRPALESFVAFRGREPHPDAFLRSHGLAA